MMICIQEGGGYEKKTSVALLIISGREDVFVMLFLYLSTVLSVADIGYSERKRSALKVRLLLMDIPSHKNLSFSETRNKN